MKSWITAIVTFSGMGLWWLFARDSGYPQIVDILGLLAIGIFVPFGMEQLIPK
jgi:hypothetical protein